MRKWLIRIAVLLLLGVAGACIALYRAAQRFEPFIREQAVAYLEQRFHSKAELAALKVSLPLDRPWRIMTTPLRVSGGGLVLYYKGRTDLPPLIKVAEFEVESSMQALWNAPRQIRTVRLERLEINVPPKRERGGIIPARAAKPPEPPPATGTAAPKQPAVLIGKIEAKDSFLRLYPNDPERPPREFEIHRLKLTGAGAGGPLKYVATLTNPKPKGVIETSGEFGPWHGDEPALTPLSGKYEFKDADLGVFNGIAGILQSTGDFGGVLNRIEVDGETRTPDFRLRVSGNRVPLTTRFHSVVDGTTGDTLLQPVHAVLGKTRFVARGGVIRKPGAKLRSVSLDVDMRNGRIEDMLRLAVKGNATIMQGSMNMRTKLEILPRELAVVEKLLLDGNFDLERTTFRSVSVQDKIDELSRKAQGQPNNQQIDNVLSAIRGAFKLRDGTISFSELNFQVPGAHIDLAGRYGLYDENIDLRGTARLKAKVSQTQSGWKRWALKPVDPFFSKEGAGTLLKIKVVGPRDKPHFGLDRDKDNEQQRARRSDD